MTAQRKLITSLGAGDYQRTSYCNPRSGGMPPMVVSPFVQEALVTFFQPDTTVVLLTETAKNARPRGNPGAEPNWERLQRILADQTSVQAVDIPDKPQTEADIWTIFRRIQESVMEGDTLIFDITYGFRSIPVIALVAVSFLRLVCNATIEALVYGAFEARQETGETPIVDLLPIATLLDWTTATDQFLNSGAGQPLAELVHPAEARLAQSLHDISQGLELLRPYNVMRQAAKLPERIAKAEQSIGTSLPPFAALLDRVRADYGQFALDNPRRQRRDSLLHQFDLIEWYWGKEQVVHAVMMAREWLVTLICLRLSLNPEDKNAREGVEALLNNRTPKRDVPDYSAAWGKIPSGRELRRIWQNERQGCLGLADLRNSIAHAGQTGGMSEEKLLARVKQILEALRPLRDAAKGGRYDPIPNTPPAPPNPSSQPY